MADKTIAFKVELKGTEVQKKKLAGLETEVKKLTIQRTKLNKQLKDGTINTKQYGASIAKVNTGLKAHRRELLVTRQEMLGIDGFTTRLGKSFRKMGTSIVAGFAGMFAIQKIGQLFSNATKIMKDFEQQMAKVEAITGATGEEFARLEKSAKELGATTQFTASEVGKLQEEYAKLGFSTEQILDASEATLELATATGSDLAQSAKVAAATINGFGLQAKDTQKIVDIMAKSFTSSALDLSKFETAMSAVAPVAATVGMSIEETTASLGVLVDAGFDASTSGTALRNILLDTQKAGISTAEAFDMIKKSADPTSTALDLFGKRGAAVAIALANSTTKTDEFTKSLKASRGAAEAMARIVGDTLEGDIKRFNSAWEGLVLNLGENANDLFRGVVEGATDFISTISDLTKNIHAESDAMQQQGVQVNALANRILKLKEGDEDRLELLNELNVLNPEITKGMDLQTISNEQLAESLKQNNQELIKNIILKREQEELAEQAAEVADIERDRVKDQIKAEELLSQIRLKALTSIELANERGKDTDVTKTRRAQLAILEQTNLSFQEQAKLLAEVNQASFRSEEVAELLKLSRTTRRLNDDLKDEQDILDDITKRAKKLEERFGKGQEKSSDASKKTTTSLNSQAKAVDNVKFSLDEIAEVDDDDFFDDSFEEQIRESTNALDDMSNAVKKVYDESLKLKDDQADIDAENLVKGATKQLDAERQKGLDDIELKKMIAQESIALAENTANALTDVTSRKIAREQELELSALDARLQNGVISQEEFEKEREAIERKAFEKNKKLSRSKVIIDGVISVAKTFANYGFTPLGFVAAAGAAARTATQVGVIQSQKFADGGYTGDGYGSPDSSGFKPAGVVHEGEYVVPKNVLESQRGSSLVNALESMRTNRPQPFSNFGFANGGFASGASLDMVDLENKISKAVANSVGAIQVVNNATDTISQAARVNNIQSEATFG